MRPTQESIFPGMDPYLEDPAFWHDFHASFITYCADALLRQLASSYDARMAERLRTIELSARPLVTSEIRHVWIEIVHGSERSLVTVIEILSPWDKAGVGCGEYLARRQAILDQHVNLIEIDLLKGGERVPLLRAPRLADYHVCINREERRADAEVYSWGVRDPLPTVPVPLRRPDVDVTLDLPTLMSHAYKRGRYARALRYDTPPRAPLSLEDVEWAQELARPMRP